MANWQAAFTSYFMLMGDQDLVWTFTMCCCGLLCRNISVAQKEDLMENKGWEDPTLLDMNVGSEDSVDASRFSIS